MIINTNTEVHSSTVGEKKKQEYIAFSEGISNNISVFSLKYELPNLGLSA